MLDTSARLLRLLALLQARQFWPGRELAERLEVTERTVRRDIDRLRSLGYPVDASVGVAGGYQLGRSASLPPLLLDDDEALAVALGLRSAAAGTIAGIEDATLRALAKLEQVLPPRVQKRVRTLSQAVASLQIGGPVVDAQALATLASATRSRELARFDYSDGAGKRTQRVTEPHGLVHTGHRWYLLGWDVNRDAWRTFRVDRIQGRVVTRGSFAPRPVPGGDVARFVSRSLSTEVYPLRARVVFFAPKERVAARVPPAAGEVEALDAERCLLTTGARDASLLALHVASVGEEFEVLEPEELAVAVERLSSRFGRAARRWHAEKRGKGQGSRAESSRQDQKNPTTTARKPPRTRRSAGTSPVLRPPSRPKL